MARFLYFIFCVHTIFNFRLRLINNCALQIVVLLYYNVIEDLQAFFDLLQVLGLGNHPLIQVIAILKKSNAAHETKTAWLSLNDFFCEFIVNYGLG